MKGFVMSSRNNTIRLILKQTTVKCGRLTTAKNQKGSKMTTLWEVVLTWIKGTKE